MNNPWLGLFSRMVVGHVLLHVTIALASGVLMFSVIDFVEVTNLAPDTVTSKELASLALMNTPRIARMLLPVAVPVGTATALSALVRRSEVTAMFAAGASPSALIKPVLLAGVLIAGLHALNIELLVPPTRAAVADIRRRIGLNRGASDLLVRDQTWFKGEDHLYRVRDVLDTRGALLADVLILEVEDGRLERRWDVGRMSFDGRSWRGRDVVMRQLSGEVRTERVEARPLDIGERPSDFIRGIAPPNRLRYGALAETTRARQRLGQPAERHIVELSRRHTGPVIIGLLAILTAALCLRLGRRQSFATALLTGVAVGFSAWVIREAARILGVSHAVMPALAAHVPLLLAALVSAYALVLAHRRGLRG